MTEIPKEQLLTNLTLSPLLPTRRDADFFVSEDSFVPKIQQAIRNKMNVMIIGSRGSGKSSLLNYVNYTLQKDNHYLVIDVDMSFGVGTATDFLEILLRNLAKGFVKLPAANREKLLKAAKASLGVIPVTSRLSSLEDENKNRANFGYELLNELEDLLNKIESKNITTYFFIDNSDKNPKLFYDIISSLRDSLWRIKARFVAVGDSSLPYLKPPMDAFFDVVIRLSPFSVDEIGRLLRLRQCNEELSQSVIELITKASKGNPREALRMTQAIFQMFFERSYQDSLTKSLLHEKSDISEVANLVLEEQLALRSASDRDLLPMERQVFEYLLANGPCSASDQKFQESMKVGRARLVQILTKLEKLGMLASISNNKTKLYSVPTKIDESTRRAQNAN